MMVSKRNRSFSVSRDCLFRFHVLFRGRNGRCSFFYCDDGVGQDGQIVQRTVRPMPDR